MQFTQLSGPLYFYSDKGSSASATLYYLLSQDVTPPSSGSLTDGSLTGGPLTGGPLSFSDSWTTYQGAYLFLPSPLPSDGIAAFIPAAQRYLSNPANLGARFVWFDQPSPTLPLSGSNIPVVSPAPGVYVTGLATFAFRNLALQVSRFTPIAPNATRDGFVLTQSAAQQIYLTAASGVATIPLALNATMGIPFTGPLAGCFQFAISPTFQNLTDLDISLRYYYAIPVNPANPNQPGDFPMGNLRYPIFSQAMRLYPNLDPLGPLTPTRSFFAFNGPDAGQSDAGQSGAALATGSYFNSILGYPFNLLPQGGATLVFAVNQQTSVPTDRDPYYLVPSGVYTIQPTSPPAGNAPVNLMCGLSGVEYIALPGSANTIHFTPGQPAFAAGFFPSQDPGYTSLSPAVMPQTSYASMASNNPATALQYFTQPDQSVLYNYNPVIPPALQGLGPVPVEAATISAPSPSALFPLLPYSGLSGLELPQYQQMESQVISQARRAAMAKAGPPVTPVAPPAQASSNVTPRNVTPQGLLVGYSEGDTVWDPVVLAQLGKQFGDNRQFALTGVQGDLLKAFESNQLFLVISNPAAIQAYLKSASAQILIGSNLPEAWTFNMDPSQWIRSTDISQNAILIVKFAELSLQKLAGQPQTCWAFPDTFNKSADAVSDAILQIIQTAATSGDPDFDIFNQVVVSPSWNGILILNAAAPLTSLPAQLAGLAAGIDASKFYAHHVGINAAQINITNPLTLANSSIFGLINYNSPPMTPSTLPYQYNVEQLKVLFLNSAVAGFSSIIDLQVNSLFSELATQQDAPFLQMFGVYQQHMVNGIPQDSYAFQTASGKSSTFAMTSNVFNAVQISQGQFVTITSQSSATETESQFVFWGLMDFQKLPGFDALSFGRELITDSAAGLNFAKLAIDMSFNPQDTSAPGQKPVITFLFDASQIAFDLVASTARAGSFFRHFPLTLSSLTQAKDGVTPNSLGFMGVQTPLNQTLLTYPWYSLNFNVNLGSTGALVAQVGFVATITVGWSPNVNEYSVFTGLKLPGSSGSKREISIQGIFDITFKSLEILAVPDAGQNNATSYVLMLYNIGFKFLSFTFPPSGQVNFVIFGNPGSNTDTNLGWYAAYAKTAASGGGQ